MTRNPLRQWDELVSDPDETPVGAGKGGEDVARVTRSEDVEGEAGGDGRARSRFHGCVLGSVSR